MSTFAAERSLDARELDRLVQRLLLLTVLAKRHDAMELLVVLTARLTAELVDFVLDNETHTHYLHALHVLPIERSARCHNSLAQLFYHIFS